MNEYVYLMTVNFVISVLWLTGYRRHQLFEKPLKSLYHFILVHVCKNDKRIQSSKSLYQIEAVCIQKAGSIATFYVQFPRYFPRFASKRNLILVLISTIFISGNQSHCHFFLYLIKPVLGTVPLVVVSFETVIGFLSACPRNLTMMLKEMRESYFKAFVRLIGLENSTDKSWGQRSLSGIVNGNRVFRSLG